jgi:hypothetical protein
MDGFDRLVKTPIWAKLQKAKEAIWNLEIVLKENGFAPSYAYDSRCKLADLENNLRGYFKANIDLKMKEHK